MAYKMEFDYRANRNENLKIIYSITEEAREALESWKGEREVINKTMPYRHLLGSELNNMLFHICGPPATINAMQKLLEEGLLVPEKRIKI
jgi:Na+-transporting NADH:ubiquinone oxidoreductase subunit NqrF